MLLTLGTLALAGCGGGGKAGQGAGPAPAAIPATQVPASGFVMPTPDASINTVIQGNYMGTPEGWQCFEKADGSNLRYNVSINHNVMALYAVPYDSTCTSSTGPQVLRTVYTFTDDHPNGIDLSGGSANDNLILKDASDASSSPMNATANVKPNGNVTLSISFPSSTWVVYMVRQ
jgi:hypothetical protein